MTSQGPLALYAKDPEATREFYRAALGFEFRPQGEHGGGGFVDSTRHIAIYRLEGGDYDGYDPALSMSALMLDAPQGSLDAIVARAEKALPSSCRSRDAQRRTAILLDPDGNAVLLRER